MLSIERCRELLGDSKKYSDEEIEKIRDGFRDLAEIILEKWKEDRRRESQEK